MKNIRLIGLLLLVSSASCFGQVLLTSQKKQIFKELTSVIRKNYVLQDSAGLIVDRLADVQRSDEFKKEYTPTQFASYLTELLRSVTKDAHFAVLHDAQMYTMAVAIQQSEPGGDLPNMSFGGRDMNDHRKNFFFTKLEVLKGNVGYLKIDQIPSLESGKATADAAMAFLKNTDALVMDLRSNPGGIGGFIPYLISYFFTPEKQLLYSREFLAWDSTSYHYTHEEVGGDRYLDKPVYVLIDRFTGSASTNMAYTMKSFGRAVLVGENTGSGYRGAHSATIYPLQNNFVGLVPIGRVVNAKTKTNWRANGVDPNIKTLPDDALIEAYQNALERLLKESSDEEISSEINEALEELKESGSDETRSLTSDDLSEYAGQYEGTTITWEEGKLYTKRSTIPIKLEIRRKNGDLFRIILPPSARGNVPDLRFDRTDGVIVSLTTIRDGVEERTEKRDH